MDKSIMPLKSDMQELVLHGSADFPIQYYVNSITADENDSVPLHWHPRPEFFTVHSGAVRARVGSAEITVSAGEGLFVNVNALHSYACAGTCTAVCPDIVFSEELIAPLNSAINRLYIAPVILNERLPYIHLKPETGWQRDVLFALDEVFAIMQRYCRISVYGEPAAVDFAHGEAESACFEMEVQRAVNLVWQNIFAHSGECELNIAVKNEHTLQIRMQKMLGFIHENYRRAITLNDIARSAGISRSEASRCFQSYLATSPVNYLLCYRVQKAMQLLRNSELTIEAISMECCFGSSAYFCKIFRAHTGMTPKQYRSM